MHLDTVKYFYEAMIRQSPAFVYRGAFEDYFTRIILEMAEIRMVNYPQEAAFNRKVAYMLVECFQNLIKHAENAGDLKLSDAAEGMFCFKNFSNGFVINSINLIKEGQLELLEQMVAQVNSMSEDALKSYYLDRLENNKLSSKGGAGLGLIEIARKSGQKILYKTEPLNDGFYRFHQQVTLLQDPKIEKTSFFQELDVNQSIYTDMISSGLRLIFKGDVSNKSLLPILDFIRAYESKWPKLTKHITRAAHVLIELSQNITKHGIGREHGNTGIIMMGERDRRTVVCAGNVIGLSDKIILEEKLSYLTALDPAELTDLHKKTMRASLLFENKENTGLGLIEIAKAANEPIGFRFYPLDNDSYLFALAVTI